MKRQLAIFALAGLLVVGLSLTLVSKVATDLTIIYPTVVEEAGVKIVLRPSKLATSANPKDCAAKIKQSERVIAQRLEAWSLTTNYKVEAQEDRLLVNLPPTEQTAYVVNLITHIGHIEFIDGGNMRPPVGAFVTTGQASNYQAGVYQTLFAGKEIKSIIPPSAEEGEIFYRIELQPAAAERFSDFVAEGTNAYTCLVIDKQVINCSKMYHLAGNNLDILPNLSSQVGLSLDDLAIFLTSGPLPISLEVVTE